MRVHVVPAGDKYSRKNHKNTVSKNVSINVIKRFITDKNILNLLNADSYAIWGVTNGKSNVNHTKWSRMNNDDICLFYRDRHFFTSCKVISKFKMRDFSIHLWGFKKDEKNIDSNETWENMFILDEIQKMCSSIILLKSGQIIVNGTINEIMRQNKYKSLIEFFLGKG